jgi:hypothetical protein
MGRRLRGVPRRRAGRALRAPECHGRAPFAHASSPAMVTNLCSAAAMGYAAAAAPLSAPRLCSPRRHPRPRGARSRKRTVPLRRCLGSACTRTRTCSRLRGSLVCVSSPRCTRSRCCRSRRPPRPLRSRTCGLNLDTVLHVEIDDDGADQGPGKGQGSGIESDDDNNDV